MIWAKVQFMNEADPIWIELRDKVHKYHIGSLGSDGSEWMARAVEEPAL